MPASAFHPTEDCFIGTDARGISRYGYKFDAYTAGFTLSAGEQIHSGDWRAAAFTPDGKRFAAYNARSNAVYVFDHTLTNMVSSFGRHTRAEALALSPDGRWAATGGRTDRMIRLWDIATTNQINEFPAAMQPRSAFSANGRWLAVMGDEFQLLEVGTWKPAPRLKFTDENPIVGACAFSPDGRTLALIVNRFEVNLFDLQTFECQGVLRPPGTVPMLSLLFAHDGSQLAGMGREGRVAVWNMREVERNLSEFDLAWDRPSKQSNDR